MTAAPSPHAAPRFDPPYTAVVFTSVRTCGDHGYAQMADRMDALAAQQPGYLGIDSSRDPVTGLGITVSYWSDHDSAAAWKAVSEHERAQAMGRERWYSEYVVRIATVERDYAVVSAEAATASAGSLDSLDSARAAIDELDTQLVALLARRQGFVERAGELKRGQTSDAVRAPARRQAVIDARRVAAQKAGLQPDVAEAVWNAMIDAFIQYELAVHRGES